MTKLILGVVILFFYLFYGCVRENMSGSVTVLQCNGSEKSNDLKKSPSKSSNNSNMILLSKHPPILPLPKDVSKQDLEMMDTARKKAKAKELLSIRTPPPPAVARRNARERNRVKQVNNGFANLRQHIPNSIAAAFESGTGRNGNKKLSKVETLRMAVEYIRSLEDLLSLGSDTSSNTLQNSLNYEPSSSSLSSLESNTNYAASLTSSSSEDDNLSSNSTPPPLQYLKSDAYHIVPMHILENNKHLAIKDDLISNSSIEFKNIQLCSNSSANTPVSPGIYSESSLSPGTEGDIQAFIPVFNVNEISSSPPTIKIEEASDTTNEEMRILCRNLIMLQADAAGNLEKQPLNINELISW